MQICEVDSIKIFSHEVLTFIINPIKDWRSPWLILSWRSIGLLVYLGSYKLLMGSRGSSGSIVFHYGLEDRAIEVRSPAGAKDFSSNLCVQTGSESHLASCTIGTGGPFHRAKRGRGVTLTTHPYLVPRSMSRSYTSSPPKRHHGV
jgi:hypothetical protein